MRGSYKFAIKQMAPGTNVRQGPRPQEAVESARTVYDGGAGTIHITHAGGA